MIIIKIIIKIIIIHCFIYILIEGSSNEFPLLICRFLQMFNLSVIKINFIAGFIINKIKLKVISCNKILLALVIHYFTLKFFIKGYLFGFIEMLVV